jgi:23S rRNA (guanosine2251-2'-O)-methyltransferase
VGAAPEAIRAGRAIEVIVSAGARATPGFRAVLDEAARRGTPVVTAPRRVLDTMANDHQGVVVRLTGRSPLSERGLFAWPFRSDDVVVMLDGITDPQNLGAAARSADAAGAVMLVTRIRRSASVSPAAIRASAGALLHLPHARVTNLARTLDRLKDAGFTAVGLDERARRTVYGTTCPPGRVVLAVGSEGTGLSRLVRERCDDLVSLPLFGHVRALNASAALAAALYAYVLPSRPARKV